MFANILTNVSVGLQKGRLDWGNDWGAQWIQKTNLQRWKSCALIGLRLPKKEMEYWLAEAEEWKQLRESPDPFAERRVTPTEGYPGSNYQ